MHYKGTYICAICFDGLGERSEVYWIEVLEGNQSAVMVYERCINYVGLFKRFNNDPPLHFRAPLRKLISLIAPATRLLFPQLGFDLENYVITSYGI